MADAVREELRAATARELTIADPNRLSWEALRGFSVAEWLSHWRCACGGECIPERVRRGEMAFWERHLSTGKEHMTCGQGSPLKGESIGNAHSQGSTRIACGLSAASSDGADGAHSGENRGEPSDQ